MKLSEKIGYTLEVLLTYCLTRRGFEVQRNVRPNSETIKSDLVFSSGDRTYILFATHTRTTGMTNRKFYRTVEELAQRRIAQPDAVCVDVSLLSRKTHVRGQYGLIFSRMFDAALSVLEEHHEKVFLSFVESLPRVASYDLTIEALDSFSDDILSRIDSIIDVILTVTRQRSEALSHYWHSEASVEPGNNRYSPATSVSLKLGMRMLSLIPPALPITINQISNQSIRLRTRLEEETLWYLRKTGICDNATRGIGVTALSFSSHLAAAADACLRAHFFPGDEWYSPYLLTEGARLLREDLMAVPDTMARTERLSQELISIASEDALAAAFWDDYTSKSERCYLIDQAIRKANYSQNQMGLDISDLLVGTDRPIIPLDMAVRFVISKKAESSTQIPHTRHFLAAMAHLVWEKRGGRWDTVEWEDFFADRVNTYFTQPYVRVELALVEHVLGRGKDIGRFRESILPRLVALPTKYRMSVEASYQITTESGRVVFLKTISTPEERHHKHKEFSGKIRAIRYNWDEGPLMKPDIHFISILDGNWTGDQVAMLSNAGWDVYDWDTFLQEFVPG